MERVPFPAIAASSGLASPLIFGGVIRFARSRSESQGVRQAAPSTRMPRSNGPRCPSLPPSARLSSNAGHRTLLVEKVAQHQGAVVRDIPGRENKGHRAPFGRFGEWCPRNGICAKLLNVSAAELLPSVQVVPIPGAKLGARSHFLHPRVRREGALRHPARPKSLDQNPPSVALRGRLIRSLESNHDMRLSRRLLPLTSASSINYFR